MCKTCANYKKSKPNSNIVSVMIGKHNYCVLKSRFIKTIGVHADRTIQSCRILIVRTSVFCRCRSSNIFTINPHGNFLIENGNTINYILMAQNICINLAVERPNVCIPSRTQPSKLFTPGETIFPQSDFMRGHGTYPEDDVLKSSLAGFVEQIGRLISVKPLKNRYNGEVGDVVVGRITELTQKRWKVDTNSRLDSVLLLSSVNLPGGELRRRSAEDEQMMRKYLVEGDLISAEVQNIYQDGSLSLHTRSFIYGKLSQGTLVKVYPALIKRSKTHFHNLPCGASLILGKNGFIWISPTSLEKNSSGGFAQDLNQSIPRNDREVIARLRNCILALAASKISLYNTSILYAYEESEKYQISELLNPENMLDIAVLTQQKIKMTEELG